MSILQSQEIKADSTKQKSFSTGDVLLARYKDGTLFVFKVDSVMQAGYRGGGGFFPFTLFEFIPVENNYIALTSQGCIKTEAILE